jgi:hypothetical protein
MSKKSWLCAALASVGLLGCAATPMQGLQTVGCNAGGVCKVIVTVVDCNITLAPDDLPVPPPRGRKQIHWDIAGSDYVFAYNGIVIPDPGGEFDQPELSGDGKKFKWGDKHTGPGAYKYSVNVVKTGLNPANCPTRDPRILNQ